MRSKRRQLEDAYGGEWTQEDTHRWRSGNRMCKRVIGFDGKGYYLLFANNEWQRIELHQGDRGSRRVQV